MVCYVWGQVISILQCLMVGALSQGGFWFGDNVVVEVSVPRSVVVHYVWLNICSDWLPVKSGQVLFGGGMCILHVGR